MRTRILTAGVLIPLVLAVLWWNPGGVGVFGVVGLLSLGMAWEFCRLFRAKGLPAGAWEWGVVAGASLAWAVRAAFLPSPERVGDPWSGAILLAVLLASGVRVILLGQTEGATAYLGGVLLAAFVVGWCFARSLLRLYALGGAGGVLWLLGTIWASDSAAYFVGRATGRRPFAPRLSPKKTWEGSVGGLLAALLVGFLGARYGLGMGLGWALAGSVGIGVLAPAGDLLESSWKRDAGVKDSGTWLPGHGGLLDRLDSLLLSLPFAVGLFWLEGRAG
ncbi:MAG: phosphatidate cytidylyltransferase [Candidatus Poribacteria bacterium]|nr:MAG: phosphatidate cytidylyltransferase [Candidatus Poribacteria bacterium]